MSTTEQRARNLANYDETHTPAGAFIHDVGKPYVDHAEPLDEATGLHVSVSLTNAQPHRWPIGDDRHRPHPASIAARNAKKEN